MNNAEQELLGEAREAIAALPGVSLDPNRDQHLDVDREADLVLPVRVKGQPLVLVIEAKAYGYPRDVRAAAHQLAAWVRHTRARLPHVPMLVAAAITAQSREWLRGQGIGYWDSGGSLYLELPTALYWIDRPVPKPTERRMRTIFRGRAAQVVHALLLHPAREWRVRELATLAEAAPSTVHQVFEHLERQLWIAKLGSGRRVVRVLKEPGALLDAWAAEHSLRAYDQRRFHRWAQRPDALRAAVIELLERADADYALTLGSGAQLVAPFGSDPGRLTILVPHDLNLDRVADAAGLSEVDEGENVVFLASRQRAPLLFRQRVGDAWVASNVQLYLDLWAWPQRGKDQARHLRRELLGY